MILGNTWFSGGLEGGGGQRGGSVVANRVLTGDYRKMTAD